MPVNYVSFYDALRFANWINNGQGSGGTEVGAYTLLRGTATPSNGATVTRNPSPTIAVTSENEWYKAAYYSATSASYFDYAPARTTRRRAVHRTPACQLLHRGGEPHNRGQLHGRAEPLRHLRPRWHVWEWNEEIVTIIRLHGFQRVVQVPTPFSVAPAPES